MAIDWGKVSKGLGNVAQETKVQAKSFLKGLAQSGSDTVGDTLKLKGVGRLADDVKKIPAGKGPNARTHFTEALGKAAPSLAAAGAYTYGAKKVYDKTMGGGPTGDLSYGYSPN